MMILIIMLIKSKYNFFQGFCDREKGICNCLPGFEGIACERSTCPNQCNDRGQCYSAMQLAEEAGRQYVDVWDSNKYYGCVCDLGFRGPDCSLIECKSSSGKYNVNSNYKYYNLFIFAYFYHYSRSNGWIW